MSSYQSASAPIAAFSFNHSHQVRTLDLDGEVWFVAPDVCCALDIQNVTQAVSRLDDDERSMFNIGRQGEASVINESGLYSLILGSRKPEAKKFKKWITSEVLPAIRKTGSYSITPVAEPAARIKAKKPDNRKAVDLYFAALRAYTRPRPDLARVWIVSSKAVFSIMGINGLDGLNDSNIGFAIEAIHDLLPSPVLIIPVTTRE